MRTFKTMNTIAKHVCPVCKTQKAGEVVLIGIVGTEKDGIMESEQFHLACLELLYDKEKGFVYQILDKP